MVEIQVHLISNVHILLNARVTEFVQSREEMLVNALGHMAVLEVTPLQQEALVLITIAEILEIRSQAFGATLLTSLTLQDGSFAMS
jgi:hypothetical protein